MRTYGKIESGFWQNKKVRPLTDSAKILLLYIYSCPHGNSVGCFILPPGYIQADIGWVSERVTEHVRELVSKGFIKYDNETNLLKIIGWFEHNTIENGNVAKGAIKTIKQLPECDLTKELIRELNSLGNEFINKFGNELLNEFRNPEPSQSLNLTQPEPSHARAEVPFRKIFDGGIEIFPPLMSANTSSIQQWIAAGCDADLDVLPEIRRHAGKTIKAWSYFTGGIMDAKATRESPPQAGVARIQKNSVAERDREARKGAGSL